MHYVRKLDGETLAEQMNPTFRKLSFEDEGAVVTISTLIRHAWTAQPPEDRSLHTVAGLGSWIATESHKTEEGRAATPHNAEDTLHTAWRDIVYGYFDHVFVDTYRFLSEACMLEGDFDPPSHGAFAIPFPSAPSSSKAAEAACEKSWDVAVFLIPAYIAKGCTLKAYRTEDRYGNYSENSKLLDTFDLETDTKYEIWYILPGTTVRFVIEGDASALNGTGLAAVMAVGLFTKPSIEASDETLSGEEQTTLAVEESTEST